MAFDPQKFVEKYEFNPQQFADKYAPQEAGYPFLGEVSQTSEMFPDVPPVGAENRPPYQPPGLGDILGGIAETPIVIGSRIIGGPMAIGTGAAVGLATNSAARGNRAVEQVMSGLYQPRTRTSKEILNVLGQTGLEGVPFGTMLQAERAAGMVGQAAQTQRALRQGSQAYQRHLASSEAAPKIDAATDAQRLGILLNPAETAGDFKSKAIITGIGEEKANRRLVEQNIPQMTRVAKREMGIPDDVPLTSVKPFEDARKIIGEPYDRVEALPTFQITRDDSKRFQDLLIRRPEPGSEQSAKRSNFITSGVLGELQRGEVDGARAVHMIRQYRRDAKAIRDAQEKGGTPDLVKMREADVKAKLADELEAVIEKNIPDPQLLQDFRKAREDLARTYQYERALNFNTGEIDPTKLARLTKENPNLTGDIAALGRIVGNYPGSTVPKAPEPLGLPRILRSSSGGAAGGLLGFQVGGPTGFYLGSALGAAGQQVLSATLANQLAKGRFQRMPADYRIPPTPEAPRQTPLLGYDPRLDRPANEVVYTPNFMFADAPDLRVQPNPIPQRPPPPNFPMLGAATPDETINSLRIQDEWMLGVERRAAQAQEAKMAAAERAARQPTKGGVPLEFDPHIQKLRPVTGEGAGPVEGYTSTLQSAVEKLAGPGRQLIEPETQFSRQRTGRVGKQGAPTFRVAQLKPKGEPRMAERGEGQAFAMSAEERIVWSRARADLELADIGYSKLSDEQLASRLQDQQWIRDTIAKARKREQYFAGEARRKGDETNARYRQQMSDLVDYLDEALRAARPVREGLQGRKTREAKAAEQRRNMLAPPPENNL
jgi:hypothetical protein